MLDIALETTDLDDLIARAAARGWLLIEDGDLVIGDDGMPIFVKGVQGHLAGPRVLVAETYNDDGTVDQPAVFDTTQRLYLRLSNDIEAAEIADADETLPTVDRTVLGAEFKTGVWDEARKGWRHPDADHWMIRTDLIPVEHGWQ